MQIENNRCSVRNKYPTQSDSRLLTTVLHCRFVLQLNKPMVIEVSKCKELTRITEGWVPKSAGQSGPGPLMQSVVRNCTDGELDPGIVTIPSFFK